MCNDECLNLFILVIALIYNIIMLFFMKIDIMIFFLLNYGLNFFFNYTVFIYVRR